MYYKISGQGKAVVLLHGFLEEGSMWDEAAKTLSKNYRVIVPDLEGFGQSPLLTSKLSMEYYAGEIYKLLKKEKVKQCVMLGHSMGGYITLAFAEKYPKMLSGFGLLNAHCFADSKEKKVNRKKGIEFIRKHGTKIFATEIYQGMAHESFQKKNKKLMGSLLAKALKYSPEALISAIGAMMNREDKSEVLREAKVRVLLINGKQDESAPLAQTLIQASYPSIADIHFFDRCKHLSIFEKKKETMEAIQSFLGML